MSGRDDLLDVIGANRNTWMTSFHFASHHIAKAVADGRISENVLTQFELYDVNGAGTVARLAGLEYMGDKSGTGISGWCSSGYQVDCEDVSLAVEAIRGLVDVPFARDLNPWYLGYDDVAETIEGVATTFGSLNIARSAIRTYRDAAQLVLDADARYSASK